PRTVSATVQIPQTPVSAGRGATVHQCPLRGSHHTIAGHDQLFLAGPDLYAAGHTLGLLGSGTERRPFLPCGRRAIDRPSDFAGGISVLWGNGRLLPGPEASARSVFLERGPSDRACVRERRRPAVAVEIPPRLRL